MPNLRQEFRWYQWPLREGATWEAPWFIASTGIITYKANVVGWETVTVPAGTFQAMHIEFAGSYFYNGVDGGVGRATDSLWYSPDVKRHVRLIRRNYKGMYVGTDTVEELSKYQVK